MLKAQAIEIIQDFPDDKVGLVIEILKSLKKHYAKSDEITDDSETPASAMGVLQKYANPDLIPLEKEAWGMAVMEKHGKH